MAKNNLLATNTVNLRTLLSNGKHFEVPPYQRDYSWAIEQWEDLWDDILEVERSGRQHYMGALVLTEQKTDDFRIIDGQQRLATLSILVTAALRCLDELIARGIEPRENEQRRELLRSAFLGAPHPGTLRSAPKLTLNDSNRRFFEGTLLTLRNPPSITALPPNEKPLWEALEFFRRKLREKFLGERDGESLANFIYEIVSTSLLFIQVIVEDDAGAYTVFETLNARGLDLTAGDLLKNYLLSVVHAAGDGSLHHAFDQWKAITNRVQPKRIPEFLRHSLNSRRPYVRQERVYKTIRADVKQPSQVFELLDDLEAASVLIEALEDPSHGFWQDHPEARRHVLNLKLFNVVQYRPLAIAVWRKLGESDLTKLLRALDIVSFRYNIISQRNTNKLEEVYNRISIGVEKGDYSDVRGVVSALQEEIYISDDEFKEAFAARSLPAGGSKTRLVRYILFSLQKQEFNVDTHWETDPATIEHILPENLTEEWATRFSEELHERYVDRLGNYLLLESKLNSREAADKFVTEKISAYTKSQYPGTKAFNVADWTPGAIDARQERMAKYATAIWRL